jgi:hypothetical protein
MSVRFNLADGSVRVLLDEAEWSEANRLARQWEAEDNERGWAMAWPTTGESAVELKTRAIGAELAAARALGLERNERLLGRDYRGEKPADLGIRTEVRNTRSPWGSLYVKPRDPDGRYVVLVNGGGPGYVVVGWTTTDEARRIGTFRPSPYPAYAVPARLLRRLPLPDDG